MSLWEKSVVIEKFARGVEKVRLVNTSKREPNVTYFPEEGISRISMNM